MQRTGSNGSNGFEPSLIGDIDFDDDELNLATLGVTYWSHRERAPWHPSYRVHLLLSVSTCQPIRLCQITALAHGHTCAESQLGHEITGQGRIKCRDGGPRPSISFSERNFHLGAKNLECRLSGPDGPVKIEGLGEPLAIWQNQVDVHLWGQGGNTYRVEHASTEHAGTSSQHDLQLRLRILQSFAHSHAFQTRTHGPYAASGSDRRGTRRAPPCLPSSVQRTNACLCGNPLSPCYEYIIASERCPTSQIPT